jgi:type VI secretion system VgrG family protein
MPTLNENAFTFVSHALPEDTFTVVRFSGDEGLSTLYSFEILLVSEKQDLDLTAVLQNPATLTIKGHFSGGEDLPFHGILSAFEQMHQADTYYFYRAVLRPRLWWLTLTHHNQVFLDKKAAAFLSEVLEDGGLSHALDFEFRYQGHYPAWEYVCQYNESHFHFVSRWMERGGAYYWFDQGEHAEKMIATDTLIAHLPMPGHETLLYSPPSGLDSTDSGRVIKRFTLKQSPLPRNILLKDYNPMKPSLELEGKAHVQDKGRGEIYLYGEHFLDTSMGEHLAIVRAEEYRCREKVFHGLSSVPAIRPGFLFTLEKHFRDEFNQQYLTTLVRHEGSQERYLLSGLGLGDLEDRDGLFYRNTFECIPASVQFRPARVTPKPRIAGTISAKVDAAGSGQYAELDEYGRYKVILPFDLSGRGQGKASCWLRMATPYAGQGHGMHFPLHKGTEVLLTFIDGDPDRPIIQAAVPNLETPSVVTSDGQSSSRIESGSGHKVVLEDQEGKESVGLFCSHGDGDGSWMWMGKRSPASMQIVSKGNKHELVCGQEDSFVLGSENYVTLGSHMDVTVGSVSEFVVAQKFAAELAGSLEIKRGAHLEFGKTTEIIKDSSDLLGSKNVSLRAGLSKTETTALHSIANKVALGVAAVGALLAAAGGDLAGAVFPDEKKGREAWKQGGWSMSPIISGVILQMGAMAYLLKKLKADLFKPCAEINLNNEGIDILTTKKATTGITLSAGEGPPASLKLSENALKVRRPESADGKGGGKIHLDKNRVIIAKIKSNESDKSQTLLDVDNDEARMLMKGYGVVKVSNTGVTAQALEGAVGGKLTLEKKLAKLEQGGKEISIDDSAIKMKFGANAVTLSSAAIDMKGNFIKLG